MYYLLSITNLILLQILLYFSFVLTKKDLRKNIIYGLLCITCLTGLCIFLNHSLIFPIAGLQWNILFPLIATIQIVGTVFLSNKKAHTLIALVIPSIIDLLTKAILCLFLNISFNEMNRVGYFYFTGYLLLLQVFIELFLFFIYQFWKEKTTYDDTKYTIYLMIGLMMIELLSFVFINFNISSIIIINQSSYIHIILLNVFLVILLITTLIFFYLLQKSIKKKYSEINQYKEELLTKNYQDIYIEKQEELFKLRHDMANMIESINTYNKNDLQAVKQELTDKLQEHKFFYTKDSMINAILVNKLNLAKGKGITIETEITIDRELNLSKTDVISLFSNLLDNAIEALEREDNKKLILNIGTTADTLEILVKNSCHSLEKTKKENPKYHGFGLKIIKEIVRKYNGTIQTLIENEMYTTIIVIEC